MLWKGTVMLLWMMTVLLYRGFNFRLGLPLAAWNRILFIWTSSFISIYNLIIFLLLWFLPLLFFLFFFRLIIIFICLILILFIIVVIYFYWFFLNLLLIILITHISSSILKKNKIANIKKKIIYILNKTNKNKTKFPFFKCV